jgi:hypothetical protein
VFGVGKSFQRLGLSLNLVEDFVVRSVVGIGEGRMVGCLKVLLKEKVVVLLGGKGGIMLKLNQAKVNKKVKRSYAKVCSYCGLKFNSLKNRYKHILTKHLEKIKGSEW